MSPNLKYGVLCAQLGHLIANRAKLDGKIQDVLSAIKILDEEAGRLKNVTPKSGEGEARPAGGIVAGAHGEVKGGK